MLLMRAHGHKWEDYPEVPGFSAESTTHMYVGIMDDFVMEHCGAKKLIYGGWGSEITQILLT